MIELTVGLPLFKGGNIAWLAFESLCKQKKIDFEWELIIMEESEFNPIFGQEQFMFYESRLRNINCVNIKYINLKKWIKLNIKWIKLAQEASSTSKVFVFQAQDVYSFPLRLYCSYQYIINKNYHWFETYQAMFYDIMTDSYALYDNKGKNTGLTLAMNIEMVKNFSIEPHRMSSGFDKMMLYESMSNVNDFRRISVSLIDGGLETNGISYAMSAYTRSKQIKNNFSYYCEVDENKILIPKNIINRLYNLHKKMFQNNSDDQK